MYYYIYYLAAQTGDVSIGVQFLHLEVPQRWYLLRSGGKIEVVKDHNDDVDYLFSDSVDIECTLGVKKLTMLFASIKEQHYKTFFKAKQTLTTGWDIYLPLVEVEEMKHMIPPGMALSDDDLLFRHVVFGGSARNCFDAGQYAAADKDMSNTVRTFLASFFADTDCPPTDSNIEWAVVVMMQHFEKLLENDSSAETSQHLKRSVFMHKYVDPLTFGGAHSDHSSHCMKYLCGKIWSSQETLLSRRIRGLFGGSGEGIMFEAMAFDQMFAHLNRGGDFTMYNLKSKSNPQTLQLQKGSESLRKVLIRSVSDIKQLKDGDVGVPVVCNFPLVDYVMKPDILLQMTTSSVHKGAADKLSVIQDALGGDKGNHKMVFVTMTGNLKQLKYHATLGAIPQFRMCPDVTATPSVLGKRKTQQEKS